MSSMNFLKGMGAGLVVGVFLGVTMMPDKKSCKRRVGKAIKTVGEIIEDISDAVGM